MSLKMKIISNAAKASLYAKRYAPEILMASGTVAFVATVVAASKASLRCADIVEEHEKNMEACDKCLETGLGGDGKPYNEDDAKMDRAIIIRQTGVELFKVYTPVVLLGATSIACFLSAHGIMKSRNAAITLFAKSIQNKLDMYRARVIEEHGEQADHDYMHGIKRKKIKAKITDENGKTKTVTQEVEEIHPGASQYLTVFSSDTSEMHSTTPGANAMIIEQARKRAQHIFNIKGYIFQNDILDMLGLKRTKAGQFVGWFKGNGDDYIDFSMHELNSREDIYDSYKSNHDIVLDFNVDGPIYHLLDESRKK